MTIKVIRDAVHGNIVLDMPRDQVILDLIDTLEFQRMRRIKQLGTTYLIYPGAEHSRYTHALGTFHLMGEALRHLMLTAPPDAVKQIAKYRQEARVAALLHDVGHGPFSHTFENLKPFYTRHHEKWTLDIIKGQTEINRILKKHKIDIVEIERILTHQSTVPLMSTLLSSPLDVDRMDFLRRDSYMCGVDYGLIDWQRLLNGLEVYAEKQRYYLALNIKVVHSVEAFILARYFMYKQVYMHKTVLAAEFILRNIFRRAQELVVKKQLAYVPMNLKSFFERGFIALPDFLSLNDQVVEQMFTSWMDEKDSILSDLCRRYLSRHLFDSISWREKTEPVKFYQDQVKKRGLNPRYYVGVLDNSLVPYPPYQAVKGDLTQRIMVKEGDKVYAVGEISSLINDFTQRKFIEKRLCFPV